MHLPKLMALSLAAFTLAVSQAEARDLTFDPADDAANFGHADDLLTWAPRQQIAGYRNIELISPARRIPASSRPMALPRSERDLREVRIVGAYADQPFSFTLDEFFAQRRVAGLLAIKDGSIVYERYGLGNTEQSRWISFSVTKSVVSLLIGAAIKDGYIASVGDSIARYLPNLSDSPYREVSIENLLHMASGVAWNEDYQDPDSDVSRVVWETLALQEMLSTQPRVAAPGEVFNYNTAESNLTGNLLRTAIGNNLSTYLHHRIWQPFGMEHDAWWPLTEEGGGEFGGCCLAATLRDYGRIGLFALGGGRLADGTEVLPAGWLEASTTPSKTADFYGYLWWLRPGGAFQAGGIFGQGIHIDPAQNLVIAIQSAWDVASDQKYWAMQNAMFEAVSRVLKAAP